MQSEQTNASTQKRKALKKLKGDGCKIGWHHENITLVPYADEGFLFFRNCRHSINYRLIDKDIDTEGS
jgi:hypothetical protein